MTTFSLPVWIQTFGIEGNWEFYRTVSSISTRGDLIADFSRLRNQGSTGNQTQKGSFPKKEGNSRVTPTRKNTILDYSSWTLCKTGHLSYSRTERIRTQQVGTSANGLKSLINGRCTFAGPGSALGWVYFHPSLFSLLIKSVLSVEFSAVGIYKNYYYIIIIQAEFKQTNISFCPDRRLDARWR